MTHSGRSARHPARLGMAGLTAVIALLTTGMAPPASDSTAGASARDVSVSAFSKGWDNPWAITFVPRRDSALVTAQLSSRVYRLHRDGSKKLVGQVPNVVAAPFELGAGGLLGVALSPNWNGTTDKNVFFMHTTANDTRVVRMNYDGGSLSGYTVILAGLMRGSNHHGGTIAFGPDGHLYVAAGDGTHARLAQDINSINGKILRITQTGAPAPGNPFGNHIYSYGHRNPQGLAWDRYGRLWSAEIGQEKVDELNLIRPGANYGWPKCEGPCDVQGMTNPKTTWTHNTAVAQMAFVGDNLYVSSLSARQVWRVPVDMASTGVGKTTSVYGGGPSPHLRAMAKVPGTNELWLGTTRGQNSSDQIFRVAVK